MRKCHVVGAEPQRETDCRLLQICQGDGLLVAVAEDEIRDFAKDHIAGYKVPKSVEFRTEPLPLSGAMKVLKKDLRAPYWEGQERAVN